MMSQISLANDIEDMPTLSYKIISDDYKIGVIAFANMNQPTEINYGSKSDCQYFDIGSKTQKDVPLTDGPESKITVFPLKEKEGQVQTLIVIETAEPLTKDPVKLSESCSIRMAQMAFTRKSINAYFKENETKVFTIGNSIMTVQMNHIEKVQK